MILVDTSIWVDHLRKGSSALIDHLENGQVVCHRWIVGELACGNLARRAEILDLLLALPQATEASHDEAISFIDQHDLMGQGLGYVDVQLLASCQLGRLPLWTRDRRLAHAAQRLGLAYQPQP